MWKLPFSLFALCCFMVAPEIADAADKWSEIPFARFKGAVSVEVSPTGDHLALADTSGRAVLPTGFVPQAVMGIGPDAKLVLGRQGLEGTFRAIRLAKRGETTDLAIAGDLASEILLLHAFSARGRNFAIVYNTVETMPSGRSATTVIDGVDLYEMVVTGDELQLSIVVSKLSLAGLDNAFFDAPAGEGHVACAQAGCILLQFSVDNGPGLSVEIVQPKLWHGYALVELGHRSTGVVALLRRLDDDRFTPPPAPDDPVYKICQVRAGGACEMVPAGLLPMGFTGSGELRFSASCVDLAGVLQNDLLRVPNGGLIFFGVNGYEGRIPWAQVYVLDGLLDLVEGLALKGREFDSLREAARTRIAAELVWWERLAQSDSPWLWSRRYSLNRADIASVVHLGRMARVASRAVMLQVVSSGAIGVLLETLRSELVQPDRVIERVVGGQLKIRKGVPFWLDGSNTPWNFQSGWIEGVVAMDTLFEVSSSIVDTLWTMTFGFVDSAISRDRPHVWEYCSGPCNDGWTEDEDISVNTPNWAGNKTRTSTAHVSYRTMDARAVLDAISFYNRKDLSWFPGYVNRLVEQGWLYPMVAAPLANFELTPHLSPALVGMYGRSAMPFEIHNQIWALDQAAKDLGGCGSE